MNMKKGFTLLELIVVIIILGIMATLGFTQYVKMIEKGRTAEAKMVLAVFRKAQLGYYQEYAAYGAAVVNLYIDAPTACVSTHYFTYSSATTGITTANRCTSGGKTPASGTAYSINLGADAAWGGTAGYF
jgi:type IV pilus assembly protein PilE